MTDVLNAEPISGPTLLGPLMWTCGQGFVTHAQTIHEMRTASAWCVSESWLACVSG